jgi:Arc/MetJ-type ribon-helix-helix transcriptional regulator
MQLTPEQQHRLRALVKAGAYPSVDDALNAALSAVETAAHPPFEGRAGELDELLAEGVSSGELREAEFWTSVERETDAMLAAYNLATLENPR